MTYQILCVWEVLDPAVGTPARPAHTCPGGLVSLTLYCTLYCTLTYTVLYTGYCGWICKKYLLKKGLSNSTVGAEYLKGYYFFYLYFLTVCLLH